MKGKLQEALSIVIKRCSSTVCIPFLEVTVFNFDTASLIEGIPSFLQSLHKIKKIYMFFKYS
jgi:hypothetical protein